MEGNPFAQFAFESANVITPPVKKPHIIPVKKLQKNALKKSKRAIAKKLKPPASSCALVGADGRFVEPRLSGLPQGWRERWRSVCDDCFSNGLACAHFLDRRLKLLLVGHNPSEMAWDMGYSYANPTNRFWGYMRSHILPTGYREADPLWKVNNLMPEELGIGLTDLGCERGNDAAAFSPLTMDKWRRDFSERGLAHTIRAAEQCGEAAYGGPPIVAFTGKRQFTSMFDPPLKTCEYGRWHGPPPPIWPFRDAMLFVLPSTSGRAVISCEDRAAPYKELGELLKTLS